MGLVFELEEANTGGGPIEDGEIYIAVLVSTSIKEKTIKGEPVKRVLWKFRLESDDEHDGRDIWGETSTRFVNHAECRMKSWADALMGQKLPPGYRLDLDDLLNRRCRVEVGKREYEKNGENRIHNFVQDVYPSAEAMADAAVDLDEDF